MPAAHSTSAYLSHYENFPVASPLLPARMRAAVRVIYAFARSADDIADEGDALPTERIAALDAYEVELDRIDAGQPASSPLFVELATVITEYPALDTGPLRALLSAFRQDVAKTRYASWDELLDYCRRSADPVGRIMLALHGERDPALLTMSDAICSALQVINFLQDVAIDWQKARIYLPQEDFQRFGIDEQQIAQGRIDERWHAFMQFEVDRARALMLAGAPLARRVQGRLGWELRFIVLGGLRILEKIENAGHDVFRHRPKLGKGDWLRLGWRSLRFVG
ncbi:MAG: squalene synthase HpnC [Pseudomonadota bacterium]|jgi:squalene synthase HpnC